MDIGVVGQTGHTVMFNVMTVKEHDSGSAIILSQNMVASIVSETPTKTTCVRPGDVHLVRNCCGLNLDNQVRKNISLEVI